MAMRALCGRPSAALAAGLLGMFAVPFVMVLAAHAASQLPSATTVANAATFTPSLSMSIHDEDHDAVTSVVVGTKVHVRVRISGAATTPTGVVKASYYASDNCADKFQISTDLTLVDGLAHFVVGYGTNIVANSSVKVAYQGSGLYNPISVCRKFTVTKATPRVFISLHDNAHAPLLAAKVGQQVHGKATITSDLLKKPTGSVRFTYTSESDCSPTVTYDTVALAAAATTVESKRVSFEAKSTVYFQATYLGDATYKAVKSSCMKLQVNGATPNVTLEVHRPDHQSTIASITIGTFVHPYVRVTGTVGTPTGTIQLLRYSGTTCTGVPTAIFKSLVGGVFDELIHTAAFPGTENAPTETSWQVSYTGNSAYASKLSACTALRWRAQATLLIDAHDASHTPLDTFAAGTPVHVLVALSGSFGRVDGTAEIRSYGDGACGTDPVGSERFALTDGVVDSGLFTRTRSTTGKISFQVIFRAASGSKYMSRGFPCYAVSLVGPTATAGPVLPTKPPTNPPTTPLPTSGAGPLATPSGGPAASADVGETQEPTASGEATAAPTTPPGAATGAPPDASVEPGAGATPTPQASPNGEPAAGPSPGGVGPLLLLALVVVVLLVAGVFLMGRRRPAPPS